MPNLRSRGPLRALVALSLFVVGTVACAETMGAGSEDVPEGDAGTSPPSFTPRPTEAGAGPEGEGPDTVDLCIATECPAPYATCSFSADRCRNNLSNDVDNCGACGNKCPSEIYSPIGGVNIDIRRLAPRCVAGQCTVECNSSDWADCNGRLDAGRETLV